MVGTLPPARLFELAVSRDFTAPRSVIIQSSNNSVSSIRNVLPSHGDFGSKNSHLAGRSNTCFHPTKAAQFLFWRGPCRLTYSVCGLRSAVCGQRKRKSAASPSDQRSSKKRLHHRCVASLLPRPTQARYLRLSATQWSPPPYSRTSN